MFQREDEEVQEGPVVKNENLEVEMGGTDPF